MNIEHATSEIRLATLYGAEGLRRCTETDEYDEWLSLFDAILDELERPQNQGWETENPTLKEAAIPDEGERQDVIAELEQVNGVAKAAKTKSVESRAELRDEIAEAIERTERLYEKFESTFD